MKEIFYISFITAILLGCNNNRENSNKKNDYERTLNFFQDSLVNHFPNKEPKNMSQYMDTFCYHNTLSFRLVMYDMKNKIDSVLKVNNAKAIGIYQSTDTCLLVINDYINTKNCGDAFRAGESTFIEGCSNDKYPVLNFWGDDIESNETRSKLPKDFVLYVLDSKVGIYSKKIKVEQSSMPNYIKHGYSKGLAISKEKSIIIYWVIIW
jgi:hypothetical protein